MIQPNTSELFERHAASDASDWARRPLANACAAHVRKFPEGQSLEMFGLRFWMY